MFAELLFYVTHCNGETVGVCSYISICSCVKVVKEEKWKCLYSKYEDPSEARWPANLGLNHGSFLLTGVLNGSHVIPFSRDYLDFSRKVHCKKGILA